MADTSGDINHGIPGGTKGQHTPGGSHQSGSRSAGNHREPGPEPRDDRVVHRRKELPRFPQYKLYRRLRY